MIRYYKNIYTGKNIWIYFDQIFADTFKFKFSIEEGSTNNEFYIEEIVIFEDCKYVFHKMTLLIHLLQLAMVSRFLISRTRLEKMFSCLMMAPYKQLNHLIFFIQDFKSTSLTTTMLFSKM